jgi:hypothetical protein
MDPVETITKPDIWSHLPTFLIIASVLITSLVILVKKLTDGYTAAKAFVEHAVDQRMPQSIATALEERAPAIFDKVVAERLAQHEEVEELKLEKALHGLKSEFDHDREKRDVQLAEGLSERDSKLAEGIVSRDDKLNQGQHAIMEKLSGVDSRVQVVQLRLESHEARISAVEQVVRGPLKRAKSRKR